MITRHGTAAHVERLVRAYRGAERIKAMDKMFHEISNEPADVSAETSRRMACDASVIHWHETHEGETLNIGRKSRSIPPATRRVLQRRDGGCRFPGCTCSRFVDAHHVRPVLAVADFEDAHSTAVDRYRSVSNPNRWLDIFVGERLIRGSAGKIVGVNFMHCFSPATIDLDADHNISRPFHRSVRQRCDVAKKTADAGSAVFLGAELDSGAGSCSSGDFK